MDADWTHALEEDDPRLDSHPTLVVTRPAITLLTILVEEGADEHQNTRDSMNKKFTACHLSQGYCCPSFSFQCSSLVRSSDTSSGHPVRL